MSGEHAPTRAQDGAEQLPLMFPDLPIPWPTGPATLLAALLEDKRRRRERAAPTNAARREEPEP